MRGFCLVLLSLLAMLFSGCEGMERVRVQVGPAEARVELATTPEQRKKGLMKRYQLGADEGMLLVYPKPDRLAIWMRDVPIPLDVGFFDQDGVLLNIRTMAPDGGKRIYHSVAPALYALEMKGGWYERKGIAIGARLKLPRAIKAR